MRGVIRELEWSEIERQRAFVKAGLITSSDDLPTRLPDERVVAWLIRCWEQSLIYQKGSQIRRSQQLLANLKALDVSQCEIGVWRFVQANEFEERLCFAPLGLPSVSSIAVLSSRLVRKTDFEQAWLTALRAVLLKTQHQQQVLISVTDTAADPLLRRSARLMHLPLISVRISPRRDQLLHWFESALAEFVCDVTSPQEHPVYLSASLLPKTVSTNDENALPEQDQLLVQLADEAVALSVRSGGHCYRMLTMSREDKLEGASEGLRCCVVRDSRLTAERVLDELREQGLADFDVAQNIETNSVMQQGEVKDAESTSSRSQIVSLRGSDLSVAEVVRLQFPPKNLNSDEFNYGLNSKRSQSLSEWMSQQGDDWPYLSHWTRGLESLPLREMPDDLLREWLAQPSAVDRTALASLCRILSSHRICARRLTTFAEPVPVVCFSAVPLPELVDQRVYQAHRTRWDAEPFGLCIRRDTLQKLGARQVVYGSSEDRDALPPNERLWFQPRESQTSTRVIDWTHEQEWRLPGDLDLQWIGPNDAAVFVRTRADAERVRFMTHWPVVVVDDEI